MSFYPSEAVSMSPAHGQHPMGTSDGKPTNEMESMGMAQPSGAHGPNYAPLGTLIQQFSRNPGQFQRYFWRQQMDLVENGFDSDGKAIDFYNLGSTPNGSSSALPLARIKKVMKNDDEVKENKRRTIQRSDIANAISRSELFDFLIDIVPRSDMVRNRSSSVPIRNALTAPNASPGMPGETKARASGLEAPQTFMPLRPSHPEMRGRMDGEMGVHPGPQPMKAMPKAPMVNEWGPPMYPFHAPNPMADARMHPGAALGMRGAPGGNHAMQRTGVDAAFMDAGSSLTMPVHQQRGSFLNMVPYGMEENKGEGGPNE